MAGKCVKCGEDASFVYYYCPKCDKVYCMVCGKNMEKCECGEYISQSALSSV